MSTPFYDLASLVLVPSGTKAQKIYAQKPLTTDGQLAFTRSTTATRVNSAGLIEASAVNVPRLDYLNSTCPRLLLEPQRTNLANYSQQADLYTLIGATIGSNVLASPDGTVNADSIIEDASNGNHVFYNFSATTFTAAAHTASVFAKKGSRDWCALQIYDGSQGFTAFFNLNTGVVGTITGVGTSTITNYGNGWYRCTITATTAAGSTGGIAVYSSAANSTPSYAGTNGVTAGYFYGWQLELGAYATSYIPTTAAAVTRGADAASKTGISSLIGQTEGTLFADFEFNGKYDLSGNIPILIYTGTSEAYIFVNTSGILFLDILNAGVVQATISGSIGAVGRKKIAFAYKANDFVGYMNGVQIGTDTSGSVGAMANLNVGSYRTTGYLTTGGINQALLFTTRLTNAQLAELTTI